MKQSLMLIESELECIGWQPVVTPLCVTAVQGDKQTLPSSAYLMLFDRGILSRLDVAVRAA